MDNVTQSERQAIIVLSECKTERILSKDRLETIVDHLSNNFKGSLFEVLRIFCSTQVNCIQNLLLVLRYFLQHATEKTRVTYKDEILKDVSIIGRLLVHANINVEVIYYKSNLKSKGY